MADNLMALVHKYDPASYAERSAKISAAKNAVSVLDTIIGSVEGSSALQTQSAVKQLSQHQKALIRIVVGSVV